MNETLRLNQTNWRWATGALLLMLISVVLILWPTSASFVDVWSGGETYNHGFAILPISAWLIWQNRRELIKVSPQPVFWPLILVAIGVVGWLLGHIVGVNMVEQMAMVGILVALAASVLGWRVSLYLAFPLLFLFFAVPVGDDLVPPMMEFTATFTVEALRWTGIPVHREGLWFELPTGSWSVVEACSGIRYIIASVTLGFLYAYLSYHSLWKRVAFIILSAIVPVIANGLRAYMIVMIGHLSGMEMATGVDHLIYGWVFFGIVMLLLFWVGGFWSEKHPPLEISDSLSGHEPVVGKLVVVTLSGLAIVAGAAMYAGNPTELPVTQPRLDIPQGQSGWSISDEPSLFSPTFLATSHRYMRTYRRGDQVVSVFATMYPNQRQGFEVVAKRNAVVGNLRFKQQITATRNLEMSEESLPGEVVEMTLTRRTDAAAPELALVWRWYRIAGQDMTGDYQAKWYEVWARLLQGRADAQWIAIVTPVGAGEDHSREVLKQFLRDNYADMQRSFDRIIGKE